MKTSEIRKEARESLKGKWGKALGILIAYMCISYAIKYIKNFVGENIVLSSIINIAYFIISIPLSYGLIVTFIKLKRNETVKAWDFLEEGFSNFGKSLGIYWHTFVKMLLPIICLILTIILVAILINLNPNSTLVALLGIALYIGSMIYITSKILLYILAYYIAYDKPELSAKECVNKSKEIMKGNRKKYFLLCLSFIGWLLLILIPFIIAYSCFIFLLTSNILFIIGLALSLFTFMLATLYLTAYIDISTVCFYDRIVNPEEK